jgi:hypothetical protein
MENTKPSTHRMPWLGLLAGLILLSFSLSCQDSSGIAVENAFIYQHVNGHKEVTPLVAFVPFEYELLDRVKYQVVYIACTCRNPEVNYYSVAFVELSKEDGSVVTLSYDKDSKGHYTSGLYGDSTESWDGTPVKELYEGFMADKLIGQSQESINSLEPMHGQVDTYTGATVTPNNAVRMLQGLFEYHNAKYMNS